MHSLIKIYVLSMLLLCIIACGGGKSGASSVSGSHSGKEHTQNLTDYKDYSVANIVDCGQNIVPDSKTFSLFSDYDGRLQDKNLSDLNFSGWNHTTNGNATEWTNLKLAGSNYNFNNSAKANCSCNDVNTLDIVLLKKIADWNRQHSNGFECNIFAQGYKFGDIKSLVFDLKINNAKTHIETVENIKKTYANYVNDAIIDAMDDSKVNIGITLGDSTNFYGSIVIQLDQMTQGGKWLRVIVPMDKLAYYKEVNYKKTTKTQADLSNVVINRMLIVGETKSSNVLRSSISSWDSNIPETFKEMDISFKKIELQLK